MTSPSTTTVLKALNQGDLAAAQVQAQQLLENSPNDGDVHYVYGMTRFMQGDYSAATEWLERALETRQGNEVVLANLGVACLKNGDFQKAIEHLKQALAARPDYKQALYSLGCAYIESEQSAQAVTQFRRLVSLDKSNADYICALGDALRNVGEWKRAIKQYKRALEIDRRLVRAHINMGPLMMHLNQTDKAIEHCRRAIELDSSDYMPHKNLGDCYVQLEDLEEAMECYANAYEIQPDSAELCATIGKVWLETSDLNEAASWYKKSLTIDEDNIDAHCGLANILRENGLLLEAIDTLKRLYEKNQDNVDVLISLSEALWEDGDAESALAHIKQAMALQPERVGLRAKMAHIMSSAGDVESALHEYTLALEQSPRCIPALTGMATSKKGRLNEENVSAMHEILGRSHLKSGQKASLHSGLAYYYDRQKAYEQAAFHMKQANVHQWEFKSMRGWEYSPENYEAFITRLIDIYTPEYFEKVRPLGNPDVTPVFIVAMPRSGTTLTEQILARHPQVLGIGERNFASQSFHRFVDKGTDESEQDLSHLLKITSDEISSISERYLSDLTQLAEKAGEQNVTRIVDKMPDNYNMVGWILTLFPNAKIIHAHRDSRDVALSCWLTQFGSIRWACHEQHLVERIRQYDRMMDHWRKVIPDRFIEMNYEDMVANQEQQSKRLIEYIGLDWDDDCLKFYESDRLVRTASITQVRQPIYNKSVARWKSYQSLIPELLQPLSEQS